MTSIHVLIIIIISAYSPYNTTSIVTEFNSFEQCEKARLHIIQSTNYNPENERRAVPKLVSHGCYKK